MKKTMKNGWSKMLLLGMTAMVLAFGLLMSCASTSDAGRYDYSSPETDDSVIIIPAPNSAAVLINAFDGQTVSWRAGVSLGIFKNSFRIRVPAGEHTLTGGLENRERLGELLFTTSTKFNFVKGKVYNITVVNRNFRIVESADLSG